jgi:hypothetical protein
MLINWELMKTVTVERRMIHIRPVPSELPVSRARTQISTLAASFFGSIHSETTISVYTRYWQNKPLCVCVRVTTQTCFLLGYAIDPDVPVIHVFNSGRTRNPARLCITGSQIYQKCGRHLNNLGTRKLT